MKLKLAVFLVVFWQLVLAKPALAFDGSEYASQPAAEQGGYTKANTLNSGQQNPVDIQGTSNFTMPIEAPFVNGQHMLNLGAVPLQQGVTSDSQPTVGSDAVLRMIQWGPRSQTQNPPAQPPQAQ